VGIPNHLYSGRTKVLPYIWLRSAGRVRTQAGRAPTLRRANGVGWRFGRWSAAAAGEAADRAADAAFAVDEGAAAVGTSGVDAFRSLHGRSSSLARVFVSTA